jgi:hypothetical protein
VDSARAATGRGAVAGRKASGRRPRTCKAGFALCSAQPDDQVRRSRTRQHDAAKRPQNVSPTGASSSRTRAWWQSACSSSSFRRRNRSEWLALPTREVLRLPTKVAHLQGLRRGRTGCNGIL